MKEGEEGEGERKNYSGNRFRFFVACSGSHSLGYRERGQDLTRIPFLLLFVNSDGSLAPVLIRLAWHASGTFDVSVADLCALASIDRNQCSIEEGIADESASALCGCCK